MLAGLLITDRKRFTAGKERAVELTKEAVEISRSLDAPLDRAMALMALGNALVVNEQDKQARDAYAMATHFALSACSVPLAAQALAQVGLVHARLGDYPEAADSLRAATRAFKHVAHPLGEAQALLWLGDVEAKRHDLEAAARAWLDVVDRAERMKAVLGADAEGCAAQAHARLAAAFERARQGSRAEEHREKARALGSHGIVLEAF
jgi:tetratricopeptide (TPR) repeat protein